MKKNIVMIGIMLVLALVLIRGTKIQSVEEYYLTHMEDIQEDSETVTISIKCDTLRQPENWEKLNKQLKDEKYVPNDGVILPETTYVLRKGDTAFDILKRACQYNKISMEYNGPDTNKYSTVFIRGINHVTDYSCGELSGWMYKVNGSFPGKGPSAYKLKDKDTIEWVYTCDLGRDVGDDYYEKIKIRKTKRMETKQILRNKTQRKNQQERGMQNEWV